MKVSRIYLAVLAISPVSAYATPIVVNLGTVASFAVLGASTVTNTGNTVLFGDLGLYSGTSITGFPPGIVNGTIHNTDGVAMQAQADALTAYNFAAGEAVTQNLSGTELGGLTLTPGVYFFSSSADLTGTLTLNDEGNSNAIFIFQIGSTLTTGSGDGSSVVFINGGPSANVFWQVGKSATLGTTTDFAGTIVADASITLDTGANIVCGRAVALTAAVTMDTNDVSTGGCAATTGVPEPSTASLLLLIGAPGLLWLRKTRTEQQSK